MKDSTLWNRLTVSGAMEAMPVRRHRTRYKPAVLLSLVVLLAAVL